SKIGKRELTRPVRIMEHVVAKTFASEISLPAFFRVTSRAIGSVIFGIASVHQSIPKFPRQFPLVYLSHLGFFFAQRAWAARRARFFFSRSLILEAAFFPPCAPILRIISFSCSVSMLAPYYSAYR